MVGLVFDLGGVLFEWDRASLLLALKGEKIDPYRPIPAGINLLNRYKSNENIKLYVISNWHKPSLDLLWKYHKSTLDLFNGIVIPSDAGYSKPDVRIFNYFLERHRLFSVDCIFIDDMEENVATACSLGFKGIVCNNYDRVRELIDKEVACFIEKS